MTTQNAMTRSSVFFGVLNGIHQTFPFLLPNMLKLTDATVRTVSSLPGRGESSFNPVAFQLPVSPHPLASMIRSAQAGELNTAQSIETFQKSYAALGPSSRELFGEKKIQVVRENLGQLSQLLLLIDQSADKSALLTYFHSALNQDVKNLLAYLIYDLSKDPCKGGGNWGLEHIADDYLVLREAIVRLIDHECLAKCHDRIRHYALAKLQELSQDEKNGIYRSIYHIARRPETSDPQWAEHEAATDLTRLISALHCHAKINGPLHSAQYLKNWEKSDASRCFSIQGNELPRGEINFINGMGTSFEDATRAAQKIKNTHCQGHAMHCVYAAGQGVWDLPSAALGQNLHLLPQGRLLIQRWTEFFARAEPQDKYLQICVSRGAIDVAAALAALPHELKQRIIVIAIAPGYLIEQGSCYKMINLVIKEDSVPYLAPNSHLIEAGRREVKILPNHADGANAHNLHGSSYVQALFPLVADYIRNNDIWTLN
jgi:hypothetical protein